MTEPIYRRDYAAERYRDDRAYKFEETRFLMSFGTPPGEIAARLGTTREALEKLALRWGQDDVRTYVHVPHRERKRPARHCPECGKTRGGKNHGQRCWDCYRASVAA